MKIFEKRILGVDFGLRRVGMALSDPLRVTAQPVSTLTYRTEAELWEKIEKIFRDNPIEMVVIGKPLNLDGSESEILRHVKVFKESLEERFHVPCHFWDERLTTQSANLTLREMGVRSSHHKGKRDQIAAALILQGFLDWLKRNETPK